MSFLFNALIAASANAAPMAPTIDGAGDPFSNIIVVSGQLNRDEIVEQIQPSITAPTSDAASLLSRVAGAALVGNGPISGQVQFRGLFSDRLAIQVNGQKFQSAGPNAMDPPLHYAPMILVEQINISRGTGSVKDGIGIGGTINAELKTIDFAEDRFWKAGSKLGASLRTADQSYAIGGVTGVSNQQWRIYGLAAYEKGDDLRIGGGGKARATSFERLSYGLGGGFRHDGGEFSIEWKRQETGPSGNPAFAMDIDFFNGDFLRTTTEKQLGDWSLKTKLGYSHITHGMSNFGLRPVPENRNSWRYSSAQADSLTAQISIEHQHIALGVDGEWNDQNVRITNPNNANFWIASLNQVQQQRAGVFLELSEKFGSIAINLGGRLDFHKSQMSDPAVGPSVPQMVANWAEQVAFNNHELKDRTGDIMLRLWSDRGNVKPRLTLAYKQRVGTAVERHSWMPTEASGGLADGNIYIGNPNLRPETAWIVEAGVDVEQRNLTWRPSIFYRRIDNFIQGVPVPDEFPIVRNIAAMNGDATPLMFANVDANIYGADMDMHWNVGGPWSLDATLSYVRGKRRDIDDNLYRIAPLNGRLALQWNKTNILLSAELVGAAAQKKVSRSNDERVSASWLIANLWAEYKFASKLTIALGVENLWDQRAADHLSGINRVAQSAVRVGEPIPMGGRSVNLRINHAF
jgi:iron complex outermembrane receptor protein